MSRVDHHRGVPLEKLIGRHPPSAFAPFAELFESFDRVIKPLGLHTHAGHLVADAIEQRYVHERSDDHDPEMRRCRRIRWSAGGALAWPIMSSTSKSTAMCRDSSLLIFSNT